MQGGGQKNERDDFIPKKGGSWPEEKKSIGKTKKIGGPGGKGQMVNRSELLVKEDTEKKV